MAVTYNYGAAPTYVKIASQTVSGVTSATFNNIPQGYTDLVLVANMSMSASTNQPVITFNGTGTSLYSTTSIRGDGSGSFSSRHTGQNGWYPVPGPGVGTNGNFETWLVNIMGYSNPTIFKSGLSRFNNAVSVTSANTHLWRNTSPITSIVITMELGTFLTGTNFTLYGIEAALTPKATGGDIVVQDGQYWYHAFRNTGAFITRQALTADVLVVAGGGGGGADASGGQGAGGGAGGIFYATSQSLTASTGYSITVGAGGTGNKVPNSNSRGDNGSNSVFGALTAAIGGGGGGPGSSNLGGAAGGSGGGGGGGSTVGAGGSSTQTGSGGTGYGNAGGAGASNSAGGGGGAGGAGGNASGSTGGTGGIGLNTWSTWASATITGDSGYFASGGNGWSTAASRPLGGGGPASTVVATASAYANTGGGGGGFVGNGGSGIVIVRYPI